MKAQKNTTRNPQTSQKKNQKSQVRLIGILFLQPGTPNLGLVFALPICLELEAFKKTNDPKPQRAPRLSGKVPPQLNQQLMYRTNVELGCMIVDQEHLCVGRL